MRSNLTVAQILCFITPLKGDSFGHRPTSKFCHKNMEIIKHLFGLIGAGDREIDRILFAWIRDQSVKDVGDRVTPCD